MFHGSSDVIVSLELSITVFFGKVGLMGLFDKFAHLWFEALFWYAAYCSPWLFAFSRCHVQPRDSNFQVSSNSFWLSEWSPAFTILPLVCPFWSKSLRHKQYESQVYRPLDLLFYLYYSFA